ncbi:biopolymer transporter ExbD [Spirulina sp. 06S082]|uniref:ExbD/TolR family protein n=1 Tax=Spirulina sp. 06S082 TaxID=3110248 RepID=UPI002B1F880F|nr:biopolymer transporter ExbD [Spirulina sp. 06S082]MEA5469429.1 biopolymer transporter ExbD [Spirulina sp. 06S082]
MQFNRQKKRTTLPEVNLIPTIDVVMCVLTFFLIISLTLKGQQTRNLELPTVGTRATGNVKIKEEILSFSLNRQGSLFWRDRLLSEAEMTETVQTFLLANPDGKIILEADRQLPYQKISQLLQKLGEIGGDRVSLAIQ